MITLSEDAAALESEAFVILGPRGAYWSHDYVDMQLRDGVLHRTEHQACALHVKVTNDTQDPSAYCFTALTNWEAQGSPCRCMEGQLHTKTPSLWLSHQLYTHPVPDFQEFLTVAPEESHVQANACKCEAQNKASKEVGRDEAQHIQGLLF